MSQPQGHLAYGGTTIDEELDRVVPQGHDNLPSTIAVYQLWCGTKDYRRTCRQAKYGLEGNRIPKWVHEAFKAERRLYVGSTNDINRRLRQHINDPGSCAHFVYLFPIESIRTIVFFDDLDGAREAEVSIANDLDEQLDDTYVYQM